MALIPKPDVTIRWAEGGNTLEPASEVQELGFVVEKPSYEVVNWLHNKHDTALAYLYQEGFPEWDIETEYSNTSYVKYTDTVYKSLLQNTGKQPDTNPETWEVAFANYQDFSDLYQDLQDTKNIAGHGGNLVYKDAPVMTDKAVGTAYSANIGLGTDDGYQFNEHLRDGLFHNGENPIVLNDGATVASFSGNIDTPSDKDVVTFDLLKKYIQIYAVGDLYLTTALTNPADKFGYGVWERYAEGRAIVGFSSDVTTSTPDWTKQVGRTFGEYNHQLKTPELPIFTAEADDYNTASGRRGDGTMFYGMGGTGSLQGTWRSKPIGGDQPHNNVQPSIVVFIWRRIS